MKLLPGAVLVLLALASCRSSPAARDPEPEAAAACRRVLEEQVAAWNQGDLEGFAAGYRRSPHTVFAGPESTRVGFDAMLEGYRRAYPDAAAMGKLSFEDLRFEAMGPQALVARGTWRLQRAADAPWGHFLLVFVPVAETWRIALDFTTSEGR